LLLRCRKLHILAGGNRLCLGKPLAQRFQLAVLSLNNALQAAACVLSALL